MLTRRFTSEYGTPLGDRNAAPSRSPRSRACEDNTSTAWVSQPGGKPADACCKRPGLTSPRNLSAGGHGLRHVPGVCQAKV